MAMLQVLTLIDATCTDRRQSHTIAYEDDNVLCFMAIRVLLGRLGLSDGLIQLPQSHLAPECCICIEREYKEIRVIYGIYVDIDI